jgi:hypothetical protein
MTCILGLEHTLLICEVLKVAAAQHPQRRYFSIWLMAQFNKASLLGTNEYNRY